MIFDYLTEVYIGKTKELLLAETQLDIFRKKYMSKYVFNTRVNSDKDLLKFDRMMEDIFGFGCFTLHIHNQPSVNAFTMPIDFRCDYKNPTDNIIADKNGFKFKKEYSYAAILGIYSGLIFNPAFTTPEIMALLLHEIGHNFNSALNKSNGTFTNIIVTIETFISIMSGSPLALINTIKNSNQMRMALDTAGKNMREQNAIPVIVYDVFKQLQSVLSTTALTISDILRVGSLGSLTIITALYDCVRSASMYIINPANIISKIIGLNIMYKSELTADNFPTIYGYGPELASALNKFEGAEGDSSSIIMRSFNKIPVLSTIMHCNEIPVFFLAQMFDEHPHSTARIKDQLDLLNLELSKQDMDPKMVDRIKKDIKECNKSLNRLTDITTGIKDPYIGKKLYNYLLSKCTIKSKLLGDKQKFAKYDELYKDLTED